MEAKEAARKSRAEQKIREEKKSRKERKRRRKEKNKVIAAAPAATGSQDASASM